MKTDAESHPFQIISMSRLDRDSLLAPKSSGALGTGGSELDSLNARQIGANGDEKTSDLAGPSPKMAEIAPSQPYSDDSSEEGLSAETPFTDRDSNPSDERSKTKHSRKPHGPDERYTETSGSSPRSSVVGIPEQHTILKGLALGSDVSSGPNSERGDPRHAYHDALPRVEEVPGTQEFLGDSIMPIAVIGMSCRFAGDATDPERLWRLCESAREAWSPWPSDRFNQKSFYHPNPERGGTVSFINVVLLFIC